MFELTKKFHYILAASISYIAVQAGVAKLAENVGVSPTLTSLCDTWYTNVPIGWFSKTVTEASRLVITAATLRSETVITFNKQCRETGHRKIKISSIAHEMEIFLLVVI